FDLGPVEDAKPKHHPPTPTDEFDTNELLRLEKEVLGLYVSDHPLSAIRDQLRRKSDSTVGELERRRDGEVVTIGGIVSSLRHMTTKRGRDMLPVDGRHHSGHSDSRVLNALCEGARAVRHR